MKQTAEWWSGLVKSKGPNFARNGAVSTSQAFIPLTRAWEFPTKANQARTKINYIELPRTPTMAGKLILTAVTTTLSLSFTDYSSRFGYALRGRCTSVKTAA